MSKRCITAALSLAMLVWIPTSSSADGYGFMTPSGNILCNGSIDGSDIACTIVERSGPLPQPKPRDCTGYWGHEIQLDRNGPARLACAPRAPRRANYSDIAPYGVGARFGQIFCQSERTGLTCRNADGHGFFLSRRQQRLF